MMQKKTLRKQGKTYIIWLRKVGNVESAKKTLRKQRKA
jgi:hypothetical protein